MSAPVALYRMFDADGVLLYVGQSNSPWARPGQIMHTRRTDWPVSISTMTLQWFTDREDALAAEAAAIVAQHPQHNIQHHPVKKERRLPTRGGEVLKKWLAETGTAADDFCERSGISMDHLGKLIRCEVTPQYRTAAKISDATGGDVPWPVWERGGRIRSFRWENEEWRRARQLLDALPAQAKGGAT